MTKQAARHATVILAALSITAVTSRQDNASAILTSSAGGATSLPRDTFYQTLTGCGMRESLQREHRLVNKERFRVLPVEQFAARFWKYIWK